MTENGPSPACVCLNMIVRNESAIMKRCLESVSGVVDYLCISDTGSTDDTVRIIEEFGESMVASGRLKAFKVFRHEWKHFGHNRTRATRSAQKWLLGLLHHDVLDDDSSTIDSDDELLEDDSDGPEGYTGEIAHATAKAEEDDPTVSELYRLRHVVFLLLDADMKFWVHPLHDEVAFRDLSPEEKENAYRRFIEDPIMIRSWKELLLQGQMGLVFQYGNNIIYPNIRLIRGDTWVTCHGPTHEFYAASDPKTGEDIRNKILHHSCSIEDVGDGGSKNDKYVRDIRLLKEGLEDDPDNPRYWFYLANSYKNSETPGNLKKAVSAYKKRIALGGWDEEIFMSHIYMGECYEKLEDPAHAVFSYLQGYQVLPTRSESLYRASVLTRKLGLHRVTKLITEQGRKIPLPTYPALFLETNVYNYLFDEEISVYGYYVGDYEEGFAACKKILANPKVDEAHRKLAESNIKFYESKIQKT